MFNFFPPFSTSHQFGLGEVLLFLIKGRWPMDDSLNLGVWSQWDLEQVPLSRG